MSFYKTSKLNSKLYKFSIKSCIRLRKVEKRTLGKVSPPSSSRRHIWVSFCRTGKMSVLCPFFSSKVERSCDQTCKIDFIVQLILANCVFWITKTLPVGPQNFFLVFFGTPQVDPFVKNLAKKSSVSLCFF